MEFNGYGQFDFRYVRGHVEVFRNGEFWFSADNMSEARQELEESGSAA